MPKISTQTQLEDLLQDRDKLKDYIKGVISDAKGEAFKEMNEVGIEEAVSRFLKRMDPQPVRKVRLDAGSKYSKFAPGAELDGMFDGLGDFSKTVYMQSKLSKPDERLKIMNTGDGADGGFLVPEEIRTDLMELVIDGEIVRPRAMVIPMGSGTLRMPALRDMDHTNGLYGGVKAYWTGEGRTANPTQPDFRQITLEAKKLVASTVVTEELIQDSAVAIEPMLNRMFSRAIRFYEDEAFIRGTGGGMPTGFLNSNVKIAQDAESGQSADEVTRNNIISMFSRMLPSSINDAVWIVGPDMFPALAALSSETGAGGAVAWLSNMQDGPVMRLLGRPVLVTEHAERLGTEGDIVFVDLGYYVIGDRQGLSAAVSPWTRFEEGEVVWRFTERVDGRLWLEEPLTPRSGSDTLSPIVTLATRT